MLTKQTMCAYKVCLIHHYTRHFPTEIKAHTNLISISLPIVLTNKKYIVVSTSFLKFELYDIQTCKKKNPPKTVSSIHLEYRIFAIHSKSVSDNKTI